MVVLFMHCLHGQNEILCEIKNLYPQMVVKRVLGQERGRILTSKPRNPDRHFALPKIARVQVWSY